MQRLRRPEGEGPPRSGAWEPRYSTLDAWRGLACLMVVAHHAGQILPRTELAGPGLNAWLRRAAVATIDQLDLGVCLFFVISGYCIAASVEALRRKGGSAWDFLRRRAWRIYPTYWAALLGFVGIVAAADAAGLARFYRGPFGLWLDPPGALDWRQWLGNLTLTETLRPHVFGPERSVYTAVAWSLCFEEQFYFTCFLALLLARRRFFLALALASVVIEGALFAFWWFGALASLRGTLPRLWHEFAVGLALFYRLVIARRAGEKRLIEAGLAGLGAIGMGAGERWSATAALFGLALIALRPYDGGSGRLWLTPFLASGRRCYSIYLVHLPVVVLGTRWLYELGLTGFWQRALVAMPLSGAAGTMVGWVFHALVEVHFLNPPVMNTATSESLSRKKLARKWLIPDG